MYFNAPRLQQRVPIKKNFLGSMPPNPPSKLTAAPLDRQISVFSGKTQSHACYDNLTIQHICITAAYRVLKHAARVWYHYNRYVNRFCNGPIILRRYFKENFKLIINQLWT